eukprot:CAMPEP_0117582498 /NCGR_PEP_ID=MMETSP0784-20121206/66466_1 /TAXON_ID=39447 /ORGANISM="" /LENGTH=245 /DNA_ID=CAMNT_0005383027 /DNA_START=12 /DNA_END=749 /DNA_ORIENTATION=+
MIVFVDSAGGGPFRARAPSRTIVGSFAAVWLFLALRSQEHSQIRSSEVLKILGRKWPATNRNVLAWSLPWRWSWWRRRQRKPQSNSAVIASSLELGHAAENLPELPSTEVSPVNVVMAQLSALQRGDWEWCLRFLEPKHSWRQAADAHRFSVIRASAAFEPLAYCSRWLVVGALPVSKDTYSVRVRVFPAYGSSAPFAASRAAPLDYSWTLRRQTWAKAGESRLYWMYEGAWMTESIIADTSPTS